MKKTLHFRHVLRTISDGDESIKVLALQQFVEADGDWAPFNYDIDLHGWWEDIEIHDDMGE